MIMSILAVSKDSEFKFEWRACVSSCKLAVELAGMALWRINFKQVWDSTYGDLGE